MITIYGWSAKWPKAAAMIIDGREELLAFYDFPAEQWIHLRTTNPVESTFSTVKLRTKVTRGAGSPAVALAMVFSVPWPRSPGPRVVVRYCRAVGGSGAGSPGRRRAR